MRKCPFKVGDVVRFTPSLRTQGLYQNLERFGLKINDAAQIEEIRDDLYLYFENGRGGFPWNEFVLAQEDKK